MSCDFIFFDAGFTLIHPSPGVGHWYAAIAKDFGVEADAARLDAAFLGAWKDNRRESATGGKVAYGSTLDEAKAFWTPVVRATFALAGYNPPSKSAFYDQLFDVFGHAKCWAFYEDALEAIALIQSKGVGVGVVSNWDGRLRSVAEEMGLMARLNAFLISADAGAEKPDPTIFSLAREKAGLSPAAKIGYIGDEPDADGYGPLKAGWSQCLV